MVRALLRACAAAGLVSLVAAEAVADPAAPAPGDDAARARQLVTEGRALGDRGDWAGALGAFRGAGRVAESAGLRFNIAVAEEHLGKLVAALADFRLAKREAARGGAPEVTSTVDERIAALEPRVASFVFQKPKGAELAIVYVDGTPTTDAGDARAEVDPGQHHVTAIMGGVTRFDARVSVASGESRVVKVVLAPLPVKREPPVAGYVIGTVGLVTLAVMGVFLGLRQNAIADLEAVCQDNGECPKASQPDIDRGRLFTGVAEVTGIVGGVALGAGVVLVAVGLSRKPKPANESSGPWVRARLGGLDMGFAF